MQGWIKEELDNRLNKGLPAKIAYDNFHEPLLNYVKVVDRTVILRACACDPSTEDIKKELGLRTYVRQLRIINLDDADTIRAVTEFLKASADRAEWAKKGLVDATSLGEFEEELKVTWKNKSLQSELIHKSKVEDERGQLLYVDCMGHSSLVNGLLAPGHFVRGSWHALSDSKHIGWHPRYLERLKEPSGTADGLL